MTDKLLPCQFCGGDDIEKQPAPWVAGINGEIGCYIICVDCGCAIGINPTIDGKIVFSDYLTEAEAIAAWNIRAERTCSYNERDMELAYLRGWEDARRGLMPDHRSVLS